MSDLDDRYAFGLRRITHAPRAAREAFEQNLCAAAGGADCICAMYDGHQDDAAKPYRQLHHCECGRSWK